MFEGLIDGVIWRLTVMVLSPRPVISKRGDVVEIKSSWRTHLLSLGSRSCSVRIDSKLRRIRVANRRFWLANSVERIFFDQVAEVLYSYSDLMGSSWLPHSEQDVFTVGLKLKNGRTVALYRFYGIGAYESGFLPDWMCWEEHLEAHLVPGDHEDRSLRLAYYLSGLIGAPIGGAA